MVEVFEVSKPKGEDGLLLPAYFRQLFGLSWDIFYGLLVIVSLCLVTLVKYERQHFSFDRKFLHRCYSSIRCFDEYIYTFFSIDASYSCQQKRWSSLYFMQKHGRLANRYRILYTVPTADTDNNSNPMCDDLSIDIHSKDGKIIHSKKTISWQK